ncbi:hypothetical protein [uncultured Roseobacter sp.]|uniref:hypothetical protein n=1 Tax=uncultured Roseobacter sp. TaxID=114847 RepID=UPI0026344E2E|nr:hypothetical protein [uncultured Roseobacter sp.]
MNNRVVGTSVSDQEPNSISERINRFADKYKLWLFIPVLICAGIATVNFYHAMVFLAFFVAVWIFVAAIGQLLSIVEKLAPERLSQFQLKAVKEAGAATLFLGSFATVGAVLRGESPVADAIAAVIPNGFGFSFIDPVFATVIIFGIWIYAWLRWRG